LEAALDLLSKAIELDPEFKEAVEYKEILTKEAGETKEAGKTNSDETVGIFRD